MVRQKRKREKKEGGHVGVAIMCADGAMRSCRQALVCPPNCLLNKYSRATHHSQSIRKRRVVTMQAKGSLSGSVCTWLPSFIWRFGASSSREERTRQLSQALYYMPIKYPSSKKGVQQQNPRFPNGSIRTYQY